MLCLRFIGLAGWMVLLARSAAPEDAGLLVLRQEVAVLLRQNPEPVLDWADRAVLAALARLPPGSARMSRLVMPDTLLRWQRRRSAGAGPIPAAAAGRRPMPGSRW